MEVMLNMSIILVLFGGVLVFVIWRVVHNNKKDEINKEDERERYTLENIGEYVQKQVSDLTMQDMYNSGLTEVEFKRQSSRKQELMEALESCNTGDIRSKTYVRELVFDILYQTYEFTEENVEWVIPFRDPPSMSDRDLFDTLLYVQSKKFGDKALGHILEKYRVTELKGDGSYRMTQEDLRSAYQVEVGRLTVEDKVSIISQRIYSGFKGFGVIDDIRDMSIDGVSGGVSGVPRDMDTIDMENEFIARIGSYNPGLNSVWVMYKGNSIHLEFLSFGQESELRRVIQNIYKYGYPGQLSESRPYINSKMFDSSRVVVVRPPISESWAFFIRKKFDMKRLDLSQLIQHENAELPIKMLEYLMKGNRVTSVTGSQGSGKTTLLMAMVAHINKTFNLRIQETGFELDLRSLYPDRNILTFQETDNVSGQEGLDLQKRTDGTVNILGEVATDPVALWLIQTAQVASLFTVFTHHAKTFTDLVYSLRNSLLKEGMFSNESISEYQVVSVLEFDIHLKQNHDGTRYIERITECVPLDEQLIEIGEIGETKEEKVDILISLASNYFQQKTQKKQFEERDIIIFKGGKYEAGAKMSDKRIKEITQQLSKGEQENFRTFIEDVWGDE